MYNSADIGHDMMRISLLSYAEITIGMIFSCTPILPRSFKYIGPKLYGTLWSWTTAATRRERESSHVKIHDTTSLIVLKADSTTTPKNAMLDDLEATASKEEIDIAFNGQVRHGSSGEYDKDVEVPTA